MVVLDGSISSAFFQASRASEDFPSFWYSDPFMASRRGSFGYACSRSTTSISASS